MRFLVFCEFRDFLLGCDELGSKGSDLAELIRIGFGELAEF